MQNYRISLHDLPPAGKEFVLDDPDIWLEPMEEFGMDCRVSKPLAARIFVLPTDGGWLVRGVLTGEVLLPCSRCAEEAVAPVEARFEDFESLSAKDGMADAGAEDTAQADHENRAEDAESRIVFERNAPMLDLAAVCWEELMLALPAVPLCRQDCKGLCPRCGANFNEGMCACPEEDEDPRMAVLRGLTLRRN